jgi:hypothetical protein
MQQQFQRAPFIAVNTRTRWDTNIHVRNTDGNNEGRDTNNYLNLDGLSDLIGHCSLGDLYWNKEYSSFGLVCGNSVSIKSRLEVVLHGVLWLLTTFSFANWKIIGLI